MSNEFIIAAELRSSGEGASRRLRRLEDKSACHSLRRKSVVNLSLIAKTLARARKRSNVFTHPDHQLQRTKEESAILKDLQRHPAKGL